MHRGVQHGGASDTACECAGRRGSHREPAVARILLGVVAQLPSEGVAVTACEHAQRGVEGACLAVAEPRGVAGCVARETDRPHVMQRGDGVAANGDTREREASGGEEEQSEGGVYWNAQILPDF